jgi:hypothetical protein
VLRVEESVIVSSEFVCSSTVMTLTVGTFSSCSQSRTRLLVHRNLLIYGFVHQNIRVQVPCPCATKKRVRIIKTRPRKVGKNKMKNDVKTTLRFGLFRLVAPSKASASRFALCGPPISTLKPSAPFLPTTTPITAS